VSGVEPEALAHRLLDAFERGTTLAPITAQHPDFDVDAAYEVLREAEATRIARGWRPVGRKIGFTNRTIWPRYGVYRPMWAHVWDRTVTDAPEGDATLSLAHAAEPRIEPEVVFGLLASPPASDDARAVLDAVAWIAPGFEIVQSHFPAWKFEAPDCTADFGLHRALVVGPRRALDDAKRDELATSLPDFELTLRHGERVVDRGAGANVLGSPALALAHLSKVLAGQPRMPPLRAGEFVTTGTVTDAWPVAAGQRWSSDYGSLGLPGLTLRFS
jgi:2-oxo-3-hexenedioate decarboxylase